jgi:hypothetical protein
VRRVRSAVHNRDIRNWVLTAHEGDPIARLGGYLRAWACEQHNCGAHHWVIFIDDAGAHAAVCYYNESARPRVRWFGNHRIIRSVSAGIASRGEAAACPQ